MEPVEKILGVTFKGPALLQEALTHSSFSNENPAALRRDNERLEFLGDALLGLVIAEKLFRRYPSAAEGELTALRSELVKRETLARVAASLGLGQHLLLGKGEEESGGRERRSTLAGVVEALLGAVLLDQGITAARRAVSTLLAGEMWRVLGEGETNPKSRFQDEAQTRWHVTPVYRVAAESGLPHEREFTVEVLLGEEVWGKGKGRSHREAESKAAEAALKALEGPRRKRAKASEAGTPPAKPSVKAKGKAAAAAPEAPAKPKTRRKRGGAARGQGATQRP